MSNVNISTVIPHAAIVIRIPSCRLSVDQVNDLLQPVADSSSYRLHLCHGADTQETYVYLFEQNQADNDGKHDAPTTNDTLRKSVLATVTETYPDARVDRMQITMDLQGAANGEDPQWHYVVETDVAEGAEDDFNQWYMKEHMPGLAAVPGTIRTMRLYNSDAAPCHHALYLLQTRETFGSEPWLAVRATDWSSRVRPNFRNTKRTMFKIISKGLQ